ncbi:hypothetical protein Avbf_09459 [Armadillidium vulgare]|nr:hypothetical protein Avbf_09459 [Armadillidium vulgare]
MFWEGRERIPACNSTSEFILQLGLKTEMEKVWLWSNVGGFMQEVHIQQCK